MPMFIGGIRTLSYGTTLRLDFRNQTITLFHAVSVLRLGFDEIKYPRTTHERQLSDLALEVESLRSEVRILSQAIDEIREEM